MHTVLVKAFFYFPYSSLVLTVTGCMGESNTKAGYL